MNTADQKRVDLAYERYEQARRDRDAFWMENAAVLDRYQELAEITNLALKRFEQACRETRRGTGPVSVRITNQPVFNVDYLEELLAGEEVLNDLIKVTKKVQPKVFEKLAKEGLISEEEVSRAVERMDQKIALWGMPKSTVIG